MIMRRLLAMPASSSIKRGSKEVHVPQRYRVLEDQDIGVLEYWSTGVLKKNGVSEAMLSFFFPSLQHPTTPLLRYSAAPLFYQYFSL